MRTQFHLFVVKSCIARSEQSEDVTRRLWGKLNSRTTIRVKTGVGLSEEGEAGEVLGQGSCGGTIVSARYLDGVVSDYFKDSKHEDLGEEIHEDRLEASIDATITARQGKICGSIYALAALWGDFRMQVVGSTLGTLDMFEFCIVSSLLNNAAVWVGITSEQENRLDNY